MKFSTWIIAIASAAAILLQDGACVCLPSTSNSPDRAITYQSNSTMVLFLLPCSSDCSVSTSTNLHEERLGMVVLDDHNNETNMNIQDKPWSLIHTAIYCLIALAMIVVRLYFFFTDTIAPVFFPYLYLVISILAAVSLINRARAWRNQSTQPRFINTAAMAILRNWSAAMAILRYWSAAMTETFKLVRAWTRTTQDIARKRWERNWLAATTKQERNRAIFRLVHIWSTKCLAGVKNQRLHAIVYLEEWTRQRLHTLKERKRHIQIQKQHDAASRIQRAFRNFMARVLLAQDNAIPYKICLQSLARRRLSNQENNIRCLAGLKLQCWTRMHLARNVISRLMATTTAATVIQTATRIYLVKRTALHQEMAAQKIKAPGVAT